MFDSIYTKIKLIKQKKCLAALSYILTSEHKLVYKTAQGLIKHHESYKCQKFKMNTLEGIRLFYLEDLKEREELAKFKCMEFTRKLQNKSIIEADKLFLGELNNEFIGTYNTILLNIQIVSKLHKFLDQEHQELLLQFYDLIKDTQYENVLTDKNKTGHKKI